MAPAANYAIIIASLTVFSESIPFEKPSQQAHFGFVQGS